MNKADNSKNLLWILLGCGSMIIELLLIMGYLFDYIGLTWLIIAHVVIVAVLVLIILRLVKTGDDLRYPLLLTLAIFGAGPFGNAGFLLFALLRPLSSLLAIRSSEWFEGLFPTQRQTLFARLMQRIDAKWDDYSKLNEVSSFQDLFTYGSVSNKQTVLDSIAKDFKPSFSPILRSGITDSHNVVRIQSAAIISRIEQNYEKELSKQIAECKASPDDKTALLRLASHYDAFASTGILNEMRRDEVGEKAIVTYRDYLKRNPMDLDPLFAIGRLLFHMEKFDAFLNWYKDYREQCRIVPEIVSSWHLEALFRLKRFQELETLTKGTDHGH